MSTTILLTTLVALALGIAGAMPQTSSKDATIVDQTNNFNGIDPWKWSYRASDGSEREEEGLVDSGGSLDVGGSYTRVAPNGAVYLVTYRADKHGFHMISKPLAKASKEAAFRASDGTIRQEAGAIINGVVKVIGNYLWKSPSGDKFAVSYKADENGFQSVMMPVNETVELPKVEPQLLLGTNTALSLIGK